MAYTATTKLMIENLSFSETIDTLAIQGIRSLENLLKYSLISCNEYTNSHQAFYSLQDHG